MPQPKRPDHRQAQTPQAEIAAALGVTCERVRQLDVAAIRKLREALRKRNILSMEHIL